MATTIITKNGSGAPADGDLSVGELAVDLTNRQLYTKDSNGVIKIGSSASEGQWTLNGDDIYYDAGNVGIGTTPSTALHVKGADPVLTIQDNAGTLAQVEWVDSSDNTLMNMRSGGSDFVTDLEAGGNYIYRNAGSEQFRIDSSGNVGIGHLSPVAKLAILGGSNDTVSEANANLCVEGRGGNGILFGTQATSPHRSYIQSGFVADLDRATYDLLLNPEGGKVGIGDPSPDAGLTVHNNAGAVIANSNIARQTYTSVGQLQVSTSAGGGILVHTEDDTASGFLGFGDGAVAGRIEYAHSSDNMSFMTGSTTRMTLDSSGNLLVGAPTSSLTSSGCRLNASGRLSAICPTGNSAGVFGRSTDGALVDFYISGTYVGKIQHTSGTVAIAQVSDERLKQNVLEISGCLDEIKQIRPVSWDWNSRDGGSIGVVAQEIQQIWPDVVDEGDDGYLTVAGISRVEARLIKAIQEQQAMIETLQAQVAKLQGAN